MQLNGILVEGITPEWLTKGRTVLIPKDATKGPIPSNFRPITCLPIIWKLMTSMISETIYEHLDSQSLLPWEQKGCQKGSRGTKDQLVIDKAIMRDSKGRKTNLAMAWVDYRKAYDMVPHTWLKECLDMYKVDERVARFLKLSMDNWKTVLESGGESLGEVKIKRGIFQGDSLSPLLFIMAMIPLTSVLRKATPGYFLKNKSKLNHLLYMDDLKLFAKNDRDIESLLNTVRVFSEDIGMMFGIDKCAVVVMKRGKLDGKNHDVVMPNEDVIKTIDEEKPYKYLGVTETDSVKHQEMKESVRKEYLRRLRKVLRSKLNSGNLIKAINTWAVSLFRYGSGVVEWNKQDLEKIDRKTRKLMTMHGALHPRADVDRLYVKREEGGRGLMSVEEVVKYEEHSLKEYVEKQSGDIMAYIRNSREALMGSSQDLKEGQGLRRLEGWKGKIMHGQHCRQTSEFAAKESWQWLKRGGLKRETESLIIAAQDQALATNYRKAKIEKSRTSALCRMCHIRDETVAHIISECSKLAQKEYKRRHDKVATALHWSLLKAYGFPHSENWYNHVTEAVVENEKTKILWDFNIYVDKYIEARRPDIVLVDKANQECTIIDIAVPGDARTKTKEEEKIEKYQDLAREISRLWNVRTKVVPVIVGALGTITEKLVPYLASLGVSLSFETIQKAGLLGSAHILRKVLEIKE